MANREASSPRYRCRTTSVNDHPAMGRERRRISAKSICHAGATELRNVLWGMKKQYINGLGISVCQRWINCFYPIAEIRAVIHACLSHNGDRFIE